MTLIDPIENQHGDKWFPQTHEEMQNKIDNHLMPVKAAVPALMMLNSEQAIPVQVLIIWVDWQIDENHTDTKYLTRLTLNSK